MLRESLVKAFLDAVRRDYEKSIKEREQYFVDGGSNDDGICPCVDDASLVAPLGRGINGYHS